MKHKLAIIGGDLRIVKLATMLAKEDNEIYVFGLEKAEDLKQNQNIRRLEICNIKLEHYQLIRN